LAFLDYWVQIEVGMIWVVLYLIIILWAKPYISKGDDRLHIFVQVEVLCLLMAGYVFQQLDSPDPVMDIVLSIILIAVVCFLIAYFLFQAWQAGLKMYRRGKKKRQQRDKANEGVDVRGEDDESSEVRTEKQKKEDTLMVFEGQSIRRTDLYEGVRGNRNPFDETADADTKIRNPLWMKQAEVEEESIELQFWQAPNKGHVERDDDEVITDRAYDPAINSVPKEENQHDDIPPALTLATPVASPQSTPRKPLKNLSSSISDVLELSNLPGSLSTSSSTNPKGGSNTKRGHRRIKSHDDEDSELGTHKPQRDDD